MIQIFAPAIDIVSLAFIKPAKAKVSTPSLSAGELRALSALLLQKADEMDGLDMAMCEELNLPLEVKP